MSTAISAEFVQSELGKISSPEKARHHQRYFKTGPGEYGEGDIFIGVDVPKMRTLAKKVYSDFSLLETAVLMKSPIHEHRQTALFILVEKYNAARRKCLPKRDVLPADELLKEAAREKKEIVSLYFDHLRYINNWDLVDCSASYIIGEWFLETDPETLGAETLKNLSESNDLWAQRVSVMTTHAFIRNGIFQPTLNLCAYFLPAKHDLIHKCTGWMLREVGKKDKETLISFLEEHSTEMPRTMLRYSIEKLTASEKAKYMKK
ncbi:DNA alkylation repair protein [Methanimicrococcus sp. OttesenSCG-928-J09]|nr:DNA alkylation repair protein [Methanimicrococcus sp. OttesenSCG-928-J09]